MSIAILAAAPCADAAFRPLARGTSWPDCSPGSRQIAFLHNKDLYLIGTSGKGLRRLTSHKVAAAAPAFSPDSPGGVSWQP